ncbi:hypothetical protein ACFFV7_50375 [Nonomuraea spiralis]|uniref:Uncharacterized protein n=1 Tax=Nonomuraea spiralis TaxID=46182 RepID=A0ABV5IZV3_9ACTN|nr:hypothetical protein [Nonomuraea spiralis]
MSLSEGLPAPPKGWWTFRGRAAHTLTTVRALLFSVVAVTYNLVLPFAG